MWKCICLIVALQVVFSQALQIPKWNSMQKKDDHILVCTQEPIELGIVLDSSNSIPSWDFKEGVQFLKDFLQQFQIGPGRDDVRVSLITFGQGVYSELGFDLTTYDNKEAVIEAVGKVPHRAGLWTDTGKAIKYMHEMQMRKGVVRPYAKKVSIVITDGNSQLWKETKEEAEKARKDGIIMFAIGVGTSIAYEELLNIAGDRSRVTKVYSYDRLQSIKKDLAYQICVKKIQFMAMPEIMARPPSCGERSPADIIFLFSNAMLGTHGASWISSFISRIVGDDKMEIGFRYGVISDDASFDLDAYDNEQDIKERLKSYDQNQLSQLVNQRVEEGFSEARGGRAEARNVVVVFAPVNQSYVETFTTAVKRLVAQVVEVFVAYPGILRVNVAGAQCLIGQSLGRQADDFVTRMCPYNIEDGFGGANS